MSLQILLWKLGNMRGTKIYYKRMIHRLGSACRSFSVLQTYITLRLDEIQLRTTAADIFLKFKVLAGGL